MKVILTASRNPALDRPAFFRHLRHVHWPLVSRFPAVLEEIRGYTQNHSFLVDEDGGLPTPWRRAAERDSVIEVWFTGLDGLKRMDEDADYVAYVRPDEAVFNDLPNNVLLIAQEETYHAAPAIGRIKRFDFLYPAPDCPPAQFDAACHAACETLALDPLFQALADRLSLHLPFSETQEPASARAVLATTASGLDAMSRLAAPRFTAGLTGVADHERSFSVLTTTFPIHPAAPA